MEDYTSNEKNTEAFTLTLEGTSLNATASRLGMSAGRVRHALHSECETRCPIIYKALIRRGTTPSLKNLRCYRKYFISRIDLDTDTSKPKNQRNAQPKEANLTTAQPSLLSRIFKSIFG